MAGWRGVGIGHIVVWGKEDLWVWGFACEGGVLDG